MSTSRRTARRAHVAPPSHAPFASMTRSQVAARRRRRCRRSRARRRAGRRPRALVGVGEELELRVLDDLGQARDGLVDAAGGHAAPRPRRRARRRPRGAGPAGRGAAQSSAAWYARSACAKSCVAGRPGRCGGGAARPRSPAGARRPRLAQARTCRMAGTLRPTPGARRRARRASEADQATRGSRLMRSLARSPAPARACGREARTGPSCRSGSRRHVRVVPELERRRRGAGRRHVDDEARALRGAERVVAVVASLDVDGHRVVARGDGVLVDRRRVVGAEPGGEVHTTPSSSDTRGRRCARDRRSSRA